MRAASGLLRIVLILISFALGLALLAPVGSMLAEIFVPQWFWRAEIRGLVTDDLGRPLSNARVVAEYFGDRSQSPIPGSRSPAITDGQGRFILTLVPGPVTLFARKDGVGISPALDLEPKDREEVGDVQLHLDPGGRVTGTCIGADGKPQGGRWIAIEQAGYRHWSEEDRIAQMRTGENGEFAFDHVPGGDVRLMLGRPGPNGASYPFLDERVVTVDRGGTTEVRLELPARGRER